MDDLLRNFINADVELLDEANQIASTEVPNNNQDNSDSSTDEENDENIDNLSILNNDNDIDVDISIPYGCKHYLRRCQIVSPCCNKVFPCRLCHDEKYDSFDLTELEMQHKIDRFKISEVICTNCNLQQEISQYCKKCNICFAMYYCNICHLFDDIDKGQFHCFECGFCRVGGKDNMYHCKKCNMCVLHSNDGKKHTCFETDEHICPICMDDLHQSTKGVSFMKCGHTIHSECFNNLLKTTYKCPTCSISVVDVTNMNKILDYEIAHTPMPDELKHITVDILCNDCHVESTTPFHVIGNKCKNCNSYNTRKT